jgi:putative glutamine amidotransferase
LIGITTSRPRTAGAAENSYSAAVAAAGAIPVDIPYGLDPFSLARLYRQLDAILLSGGGDIAPGRYGARPSDLLRSIDAERDGMEINLARWAVEGGKPILGICRGLQILNVALGGTLIQDIITELPGALTHDFPDTAGAAIAHSVALGPGPLREALGGRPSIDVNSSHHQAVEKLGVRLMICGTAPDGVVEAIEVPGHPFALAVQWHPERLLARPEARALFSRLTEAARRE